MNSRAASRARSPSTNTPAAPSCSGSRRDSDDNRRRARAHAVAHGHLWCTRRRAAVPRGETPDARARSCLRGAGCRSGRRRRHKYFYPVDNSVIAKYEIASGKQIDRWDGAVERTDPTPEQLPRRRRPLWCANSNYPQVPMGSSIEVFDTATLDHVSSHSLGLLDEGSITWFDKYRGGFIAGFAHYDGANGAGFKDHRYLERRHVRRGVAPHGRLVVSGRRWSSDWRLTPRREARSAPTAGCISSATIARRCTSSDGRRWARR